MESRACTINATGIAVERFERCFCSRNHCFGFAICRLSFSICLLFRLFTCFDLFALVIVDVSPDFEVQIRLGRRGCRFSTVGRRMWLSRSCYRLLSRLEWLESTRSVCCDFEVSGERRADIGGSSLGIDLFMSVTCRHETLNFHTW